MFWCFTCRLQCTCTFVYVNKLKINIKQFDKGIVADSSGQKNYIYIDMHVSCPQGEINKVSR
jgi:hypothetical protein